MAITEKPEGLNQAQIAFLGLLANISDEKELDELRRVVARHLANKIRKTTQKEATELNLTTKEGYNEFIKKNHKRTPYK